MFISTVRTRHLADLSPVLAALQQNTDVDGDVGNFGFLSDQKLLNTAFTRAQYLVAVVGDPVALCAIGECMNVWRAFLKHCQNLTSIYPKSVTLETVRNQVQTLMNSAQGQNVQQLNALTQEGAPLSQLASAEPGHHPEQLEMRRQATPEPGPFEVVTTEGVFQDWSLDYRMDADSILYTLAAEAQQIDREEKHKLGLPVPDSTEIRMDWMKMARCQDQVVIQYCPGGITLPQQREQHKAEDIELDYSDEEDDLISEAPVVMNFGEQQLQEILVTQPTRYKRCTLHVEDTHIYAKIADATLPPYRIEIGSRQRCKQALHNDEVVVEILTLDPDEVQLLGNPGQVVCGQVVGILSRYKDPRKRMFVCSLEQGSSAVMVPLNREIPKIYNLVTKTRLSKTKKGHVCVYTFSKDKELLFHHYERVDPVDNRHKLFLVRYLEWHLKLDAPVGVVVGVLNTGSSIDQGLQVLNLEYYVAKTYTSACLDEVEEQYPQSYKVSDTDLSRRLDFRKNLTFTVGSANTKELGTAFSIEDVPGNCYKIGVHIADVSHYVKRGSALDREAEARATTMEAFGREPTRMLPELLSTKHCSLLPGEDRLTISIFLTIDAQAQILNTQLKRCMIRSSYQLDHEQAEAIIKGDQSTQAKGLYMALLILSKISSRWRETRLGNGAVYHSLDPVCAHTPTSHAMLEDVLIMANHHIAMQLVKLYPGTTPLMIQRRPNQVEVQEWKQRFQHIAANTVGLTRTFLPKGRVCHCSKTCSCITIADSSDFVADYLDIQASVWSRIRDAVVDGRMDELKSLVVSPELHPQLAVARLQLDRIQPRPFYASSASVADADRYHYTLNQYNYTTATSPLTSYMDLAVQRLVSAMIDGQSCPYSESEVMQLCRAATVARHRAEQYHEASQLLQLASSLHSTPTVFYPVLESIDHGGIQLRLPTLPCIPPSLGYLNHAALSPAHTPHLEGQQITLTWYQRIYNLQPDPEVMTGGMDSLAVLNTDRFVVQLPTVDWQNLMLTVLKTSSMTAMLEATVTASENVIEPNLEEQFSEDVSSEVSDGTALKSVCSYSMTMEPASMMKIQMAADNQQGILTPRMQLVELTPTLGVCLEHTSDAVQCFAKIATQSASKVNYRDVDSYHSSWLSVLAMESAMQATAIQEATIIHNVQIHWREVASSPNKYTAKFSLPLEFCIDRGLNFTGAGGPILDKTLSGTDPTITTLPALDYFCIRYTQLPPQLVPYSVEMAHYDIDTQQPVTWVGHCVSTEATVSQERGVAEVELSLQHSSVAVPSQLLKQPADQLRPATVEWIPSTARDR